MNFITRLLYFFLKFPLRQKIKSYAKDLKMGNFCHFSFYPNAQISFEKNIEIRNYCNIWVEKNAQLHIKENFFMNNYCSINCLEKIEIGENTLFGEGVKLYDHNHQYHSKGVEKQKFNTAPIKIGKNCWLGSNVIVLKGVNIGDNSIIGAGCVIHKDVPANSIIINKQEQIIRTLQ